MTNNTHKTSRGFTLIELSVILVIVGLLLGTAVTGLTTFIQRARFTQTEKELEIAKEAIIGFTLQFNRLPCPDSDGFPPGGGGTPDGIENQTAAGCTSLIGYIPWVDLGITSTDPWGTLYFYRVSNAFADDPIPGNTVSFDLTTIGDIQVEDENDAAANAVANNIPALVFSVGPNANITLAAASIDEDENIDGDFDYVSKTYVAAGAAEPEFDDILKWVSPHILRLKMVEAGKLPE